MEGPKQHVIYVPLEYQKTYLEFNAIFVTKSNIQNARNYQELTPKIL